MNYHKLLGLGLSVILFCATSSAQDQKTSITPREPDYNKPKLFATLPDKISMDTDSLGTLFLSQTGKLINVGFADKAIPAFAGKVISVASKYENRIQSIVIRSSNFNGATLTLSSTTMADGTTSYTGRIISFQNGDAYELQKKDNQYAFMKKNLYDLMNE